MTVYKADVRCNALINEIYHQRKVGVEVGVFKGDLSWRLLGSNRNLFLYMVDPWGIAGTTDQYKQSGDRIAEFSQGQHDDAMHHALQEVAPFDGRYEVMRMTSLEAADRFADASVDFVFIDADHSYEGCKSDIAAWWDKVKPGGLLSGHDYRSDKDYGVIQAVDEFAAAEGRILRLGGNWTWFVTK